MAAWGSKATYGQPVPRPEAIDLIHAAFERGVTLFDTAEVYGPFDQRAIGRRSLEAVPRRGQRSPPSSVSGQSGRHRAGGLDSRPEHIREVVDASLKRLQIDTIDLLYQHRVDPAVPIEDVAGTVKELIGEGKVRHYRPVRSERPDHSPRPCCPSGHCGPERIFALDP